MMLKVAQAHHQLNDHVKRSAAWKWWTLGYFPSGRILVSTPHGEHYRVGPSASLTPPHTPYTIRWAGGNEEWMDMYAFFDPLPEWSSLLSWPEVDSGIGLLPLKKSPLQAEVEKSLRTGLWLQNSAHPNQHALTLNVLEGVLLLLDGINPLRGYGQRDARIVEAMEYISKHYHRALDVPLLAKRACLSPSHFAHLFRSQLGMTPMQYIEHYRLERAAELLLTTNDYIQQVARATGFKNAFHFSTRFRSHFGQTPRNYRKTAEAEE